MKKLFISIFIIFIFIFCFNLNASVNATTYEEEDGYIEPVFGNDEIAYGEEEWIGDRDDYEFNNQFYTATDITSMNNQNIYATLHRLDWYVALVWRDVDQDFYRVDVFGDAHIDITLDVPTDKNYNVDLWRQIDTTSNSFTNAHIISMMEYCDVDRGGEGETETITLDGTNGDILTAGTYYIRVYSYGELYYSNQEYCLSYSLDYQPQNNMKISEMRFNKGAKAALWKSDFTPFGEEYYEITEDVSFSAFHSPIHDSINMYSQSYGVVDSVLYIWDTEWRNEMSIYLEDVISEIQEILELYERVKLVVEVTEETFGVVGITIQVIGSVIGQPIVTIVGEVVSTVGESIGKAARLLFPEVWDTSTQDALNYFVMLKNILECEINEDSEEVVIIRNTYYYDGHKIVYRPHITVDETFYHYSDIITAYNSESHTYGKIYPLRNNDDVQNVIDGNTDDLLDMPDVNTCSPITIYANQTKTGNLIKGKYYWYKLEVPVTGNYSFYSSSDIDLYGELFTIDVAGRSVNNKIAGDSSTDDAGDGLNFKIDYTLSQGQIIYLRVRGYGWSSEGTFAVTVETDAHIHQYTSSYEQYSSLKHKAFCSCGDYITTSHTIVNNVCTKCGVQHTHSYFYTPNGNGRNHTVNCACGYSITEACMGLVNHGSASVCVKCNQTLISGGIIFSNDDNEITPYIKQEEDNTI